MYQVMPPLDDDTYATLRDDIQRHGVLVPIELDEDGNVLDGHNRVRAWTELRAKGVNVPDYPRLTRYGLTDEQKRVHARKLNMVRRALSSAQKREVIKDQLRETPGVSNRQIGKFLGVDDKTVGSVRAEMEAIAEIPQCDRETSDGRSYPRQRATPQPDDDDALDPYEQALADQMGLEEPEPAPEPHYAPAVFASDSKEQQQAQKLTPPQTETQTVSVQRAQREQVRQRRADQQARAQTLHLTAPEGKYQVIYADPPWRYGNTMPDTFTEQRDHYPTMTIDEIAALPVKDIADTNAVLFLWVTSPIIYDAKPVIDAWGFTYKAMVIWDKELPVLGHYTSVRHELLLICVRGSFQPHCPATTIQNTDSVQVLKRHGSHSSKPEHFRDLIQALYPHGRRIELFARSVPEGWDTYGLDVPQESAA